MSSIKEFLEQGGELLPASRLHPDFQSGTIIPSKLFIALREREGLSRKDIANQMQLTEAQVETIELAPDDQSLSVLRRYMIAVGFHVRLTVII